ncbi:MAG: patatin-like phospholipase family protein [Rickettsia endosymbiont of Labidopullus appendiculatus]|nr:patatin-like phospholipase family protein [Rickettsia endosymbiont of Labidopullus appendiculatus]
MSTNQTGQNKVLCLTGGGMKGMAELVVLQKIEEITGQPISKLFNIISGTSVGGLIAALLTIPKEEGSTEPRYSAKEALELFENAAPEIFPKSWFNWGIIKHKYSQEPLKKMLEEHLGDNRLDDSLCRLIIPVADLNGGKNSIKIFDSEDKHSVHIRTKDVLLATTAAPTYFKAVVNKEAVSDYDYAAGKPYAFADGGLGANRPAAIVLQVLKEGHTYHEQADIMERTSVCSINFGVDAQTKAQIPSANFDGALGWLLNGLVDMIMKNDEEGDATEVRLDLTGEGQNTEIVLPITKECKNLDDSSKSNIAKLKIIAEQYLANNSKLVQDLCDRLMADYQDNLEESKVLNTNSNAMVGDENNDEGYKSGDNCSDIVEAAVELTASSMVSAKLEPGSTLSEVNKEIDTTVAKPTIVENLQEAVVMVGDEVNDEGYESDDNCSDIVETTVERTVSAMVSAKLEPASILVATNGDTESTINAATLQKAIQ